QGRFLRGRVRGAGQGGLVEHGTAAPLLPALVLRQVNRLAGGEEDEELPQVQAVVQLGEAVLPGASAEAVEGAEGHVLLVGGGAGPGQGPDRWRVPRRFAEDPDRAAVPVQKRVAEPEMKSKP